MDPGASMSKTHKPILPWRDKFKQSIVTENYDPIVMKLFLHTCMKLLSESKAIEELQQLIGNCASKDKLLPK